MVKVTQTDTGRFFIETDSGKYLTEKFEGDELLDMEYNTLNDWKNYLRTSQSYQIVD